MAKLGGLRSACLDAVVNFRQSLRQRLTIPHSLIQFSVKPLDMIAACGGAVAVSGPHGLPLDTICDFSQV
jgi:hypothetical protein